METQLTRKTQERAQYMAAAHNNSFAKERKGFFLEDNRKSSKKQQQLMDKIHATTIIQKKPNKTGLPDNLKSGIESLSGHSLDDVKVHYNSPKPAQLNAHAYAQGTDIHVASGQKKHVPHEAWHVVQQKQGRVQPTTSINGAKVNDNASLEKEADVMGSKALQRKAIRVQPSARSYRANVFQLQAVIQLLQKHAKEFIDSNSLGIGYSRDAVKAYVDDTSKPRGLRRGLMNAWNKPKRNRKRNALQYINTPSDLEQTSTEIMQTDDLGSWDSADEDEINIKNTINKRKKGSVDLKRVKKESNKSDVPILGLHDAVKIGRQVNKRDQYQHLPFSVDIGGHMIEFDNPGTKDIYATPLQELDEDGDSKVDLDSKEETEETLKPKKTIKKASGRGKARGGKLTAVIVHKNKKYKRTGTSSDFNWKTLSQNLDNRNYDDPKSRQLQILNFFLKKSKNAIKIDRETAEAIAAIASDLMKGSKGGRYYLMHALKQVEHSSTGLTFQKVFYGDKALYEPAKGGGRKMVTNKTNEINLDANRVLEINNCLINAISRAARGHDPNLGEIIRIREQIGSYGNMLIASERTVNIIRNVLHIQNPIHIEYTGPHEFPENFGGIGDTLTIYHINGDHFTNVHR